MTPASLFLYLQKIQRCICKEVFMALSITMNKIRERISLLQSVGVSARALAAVHGISPNKLQNGVDGVVYLGAEVESDLSQTASLLLDLERVARPLRLPSDKDALRKLVEHVKTNNISTEQIRSAISGVFGVE
jgi:hypothetical protein